MTLARQEIEARLRDALARRDEVLEAYLFGSVARGEAQAHSDVDVAVYPDPARARDDGFGYEANLAADLSRALGSDRVEVVRLDRAPPLLYHRVLRDGVRLLSRDLAATTTREGYALSRYCDWVPQMEKIERAARARIEAGEFGR